MSDTDSDWDSPDVASIPGPGASKGELLDALKALQIDVQKLHEENKALKEENKVLLAEKPKCKWKVYAEPPDKLIAHKSMIVINARKYGLMMEMFLSKDLLNKLLPSSPTPFDSVNQYKTTLTQELAFLDELYHGFPERVHIVMESSYFAELVLKSIMDACLSEIKKLQSVAGIIFGLPSKYFTSIGYHHAGVSEIRQLLGVTSATNLMYMTFPPVLFPDLIEDKSLKTVFQNWKLLVQILKVALHGGSEDILL